MCVADDSSPYLASSAAETTATPPADRLAVAIIEEGGDWSGFGPLEAPIHKVVAALARHRCLRRMEAGAASIVLASDAIVRKLNCDFRGTDSPTNVLSFPFQAPPGAARDAGAYLGDVVLAAETVAREAAERAIEPTHHLQHLVIHGLLHLLGYDHQTDAQAEAMETLETEVLAAIGIPDPYAASVVSS